MTGNVFFRMSLVDNVTKAAENAEAQCLDMLIPNDVRIRIDDAIQDAWSSCVEMFAIKKNDAPFYAIVDEAYMVSVPRDEMPEILCCVNRVDDVVQTVWNPAELKPVRER